MPLGCEFGAQIDLNGGSFDGRFIGTVAGHLFWRNPAQGCSAPMATSPNGTSSAAFAPGTSGRRLNSISDGGRCRAWPASNSAIALPAPSARSSRPSTCRTRFFDQVNLAYYPIDNLQLYVGHRYLGGKNAAAFGGEWGIPMSHGVMAALFAEGRVGEDSYHGSWGGVRFYFGQKDKTLIRRHREDDPTNWDNGAGFHLQRRQPDAGVDWLSAWRLFRRRRVPGAVISSFVRPLSFQ